MYLCIEDGSGVSSIFEISISSVFSLEVLSLVALLVPAHVIYGAVSSLLHSPLSLGCAISVPN